MSRGLSLDEGCTVRGKRFVVDEVRFLEELCVVCCEGSCRKGWCLCGRWRGERGSRSETRGEDVCELVARAFVDVELVYFESNNGAFNLL